MPTLSRFSLAALLAFATLPAAARADDAVIDGHACVRPAYPADAVLRKSEGTTTLLFKIDTDGAVIDARLQKSSGDAELDEAARAALVRCHFKPAQRNGKPVTAWVPVQFVWTLPKAD